MKVNKYKNVKVIINNIKFDSQKEARYYGNLLLLQKSGEVIKFDLQPRYDIIINGINCGFYKGDFLVYYKSGEIKLIDVKSSITRKLPVYNLKKKLIKAIYGLLIHEV